METDKIEKPRILTREILLGDLLRVTSRLDLEQLRNLVVVEMVKYNLDGGIHGRQARNDTRQSGRVSDRGDQTIP
jgi:hypothetical protein